MTWTGFQLEFKEEKNFKKGEHLHGGHSELFDAFTSILHFIPGLQCVHCGCDALHVKIGMSESLSPTVRFNNTLAEQGVR